MAALISFLVLSLSIIANAQEAVPGEFVVLLKPSFQESKMIKQLEVDSQQIGELSIRLIRIPQSQWMYNQGVLNRLMSLPEVELLEPNYIYNLEAEPSPSRDVISSDPDLTKQWGLQNTGQPDGWGRPGRVGIDSGVTKGWSIQKGSKNIIVATVDSGINYNHPDLQENIWINMAEQVGKPGVDDDNNGYVDDIHGYDFVNSDGDPMDDHGHGTHVASIIGSRGNNQLGMAGVSWEVSLMPLKFASKEGKGTLELGIRAIQYATKMGAHIINNSWGGQGYSEILTRVVEEANKKNILFVAAAGNSGWDNIENPIYPASLKNENVLSVAAFDQQGQLWNGSCYGESTVHIGAPGVEVWGLWLDKYRKMTGTSMAAPHVSGIAALIMAQEPLLTVKELKDRILKTARPVANLRGKTMTGATADAFLALSQQTPSKDNDDPYFWTNKKTLSISTSHPYENRVRQEWEVKIDGAKEIAVYFENFELEKRVDRVELFDNNGHRIYILTGKTGKGWSPIIRGDYIKVVLVTDDFRNFYGFDLTQVAYR